MKQVPETIFCIMSAIGRKGGGGDKEKEKDNEKFNEQLLIFVESIV